MDITKKINEAIAIIRKYYNAVSVQRTENENIVYPCFFKFKRGGEPPR